MRSEQRKGSGRTHTVRPRWTWISLAMMVVGLVLIGVGIVVPSWAWAIPGIVVLLIGGVAGLYGGFFYDVHGGPSASGQLRDAVEGNEYEFPGRRHQAFRGGGQAGRALALAVGR